MNKLPEFTRNELDEVHTALYAWRLGVNRERLNGVWNSLTAEQLAVLKQSHQTISTVIEKLRIYLELSK